MFTGKISLPDDINAPLTQMELRSWRVHFGTCPRTSLKMWNLILLHRFLHEEARKLDPFYFFMTLYFLKVYPTNDVLAGKAQRDPKTVRYWIWKYTRLMASLLSILVSLKMSKKLQPWFSLLSWRGFHLYDMTQVCWDDRLHNAENRLSKISTDGTDCLICEPTPFCRSWYSHKLNKAALRYEISVAVGCSKVVWVHGPFRAGSWTDIKIFKKGLRQMLHFFGEMTIADGGYQGLDYWVQAKGDPRLTPETLDFNTRAHARHETVNRRIKTYDCLNQRWRHPRCRHKNVFMAITCLTNIQMEYEPLFDWFTTRKEHAEVQK